MLPPVVQQFNPTATASIIKYDKRQITRVAPSPQDGQAEFRKALGRESGAEKAVQKRSEAVTEELRFETLLC
jgi:hypothetical protein